MYENNSFTISEVQKKGFSHVIKTANEKGFVLVTKNSEPSVLIMPLTILGMKRFVDVMNKEIENDTDAPSDIVDIFAISRRFLNTLPFET